MPAVTKAQINDQASMTAWCEQFSEQLKQAGLQNYRVEVSFDKEEHLYLPDIIAVEHGIEQNYLLDLDFFEYKEYENSISYPCKRKIID